MSLEQQYTAILGQLGEDVSREGLLDTPKRAAKAMQYLQTADFKDLVNNLIAKTLLLKIYYQLGEFEILESHLDSFRQFISRREISEYHRKNYSNIVAVVKKMLGLQPGDEKGRAALREKIRTTEVLTEREWLLGQLG